MPGRQVADQPHEVVWISHKRDQSCARCGRDLGRGSIVQVNEKDGVRCAACAGYHDLCFLPAGDARLTRLATSLSSRVVTVVRWSNTRKRNERQGILIEEDAYDAVIDQVEAEARVKGKRATFRVIEMDGEKMLWRD